MHREGFLCPAPPRQEEPREGKGEPTDPCVLQQVSPCPSPPTTASFPLFSEGPGWSGHREGLGLHVVMLRLGSNSGWMGRGHVLCRLDLGSDMLLSHGDLRRMVGKLSCFLGTWDVSSGLEAATLLPGLASLPGSLGLGAPSSPAGACNSE